MSPEEAIRHSIHDPARFQEKYLQRRLWAKQREIAHSVATRPLTAVKGCHASGKSFLASGLPLWWLIRHMQAKVFTTAPTLRQVKLMWEEIAMARKGSILTQILPEPSTAGLKIDEARYGIGASSSKGVNVQGLHSGNVLIIADEAPGIMSEIWDAIEGIRAGGRVRMLELGNPVIPSGHFYDSFTRHKAIYNTISISAFDTPNFAHESEPRQITMDELLTMDEGRLEFVPFPALITRSWVKERYLTWGPANPAFLSRVMAEFPPDSPYACFPLTWLERAQREPTEKDLRLAAQHRIQFGIDVAGAGSDETALCARVGGIVLKQEAWHMPDPRGSVIRTIRDVIAEHPYQAGPIVVDIVGIGYNFARSLADVFPDRVFGFNAGARPMSPQLYFNTKAEGYFTLRGWLQADAVCSHFGKFDMESFAQLSAIQYKENSRGVIEIEKKDDMRKRGALGGQSPDRAEAMVMAFHHVAPIHQRQERNDLRVEISPI